MKYIQVKITTTHEGAEILTGVLMNAGINDISIHDPDEIRAMLDCVGEGECYDSLQVPDNDDRDVTLSVFLPDTKEGIRKASEIKQRVGRVREDIGGLIDLGWLDVTASTTDDVSWRDKWKDYFVPFRVTESIVVKPTWRKYEPLPGDLVIELDPGMAFGTGSHETTSLAMKMMEKYIKKGDRVLDVGTGSGILCIAAKLLGASDILGTDIDTEAVRTARDNIKLNCADDSARVIECDLVEGIDCTADVVVANLLADLVMTLSDYVKKYMSDDAVFISSGILTKKRRVVEDHMESVGLEVIDSMTDGEWTSLVAKKIRPLTAFL